MQYLDDRLSHQRQLLGAIDYPEASFSESVSNDEISKSAIDERVDQLRNNLDGRLIEKSSLNGKDTSGEFAITRNYEKKDGKWICLNSNLNPLMPKP